MKYRKHAIIPDTQIKPGARLDQNKVRIAKWVRGMGWEDLEDSE